MYPPTIYIKSNPTPFFPFFIFPPGLGMTRVVIRVLRVYTSGNNICEEFYVNNRLVFIDAWCDYNQAYGEAEEVREFSCLEEAIEFLTKEFGLDKNKILEALKALKK